MLATAGSLVSELRGGATARRSVGCVGRAPGEILGAGPLATPGAVQRHSGSAVEWWSALGGATAEGYGGMGAVPKLIRTAWPIVPSCVTLQDLQNVCHWGFVPAGWGKAIWHMFVKGCRWGSGHCSAGGSGGVQGTWESWVDESIEGGFHSSSAWL